MNRNGISVSLGTLAFPQQPWQYEALHLALCLGGPLQPSSSPLASISLYSPAAPASFLLVPCHERGGSSSHFSSEWQANCQGLEPGKSPWMLGEAAGLPLQCTGSEKTPGAQRHTASASLAVYTWAAHITSLCLGSLICALKE